MGTYCDVFECPKCECETFEVTSTSGRFPDYYAICWFCGYTKQTTESIPTDEAIQKVKEKAKKLSEDEIDELFDSLRDDERCLIDLINLGET